jgi:cytochrome P450/NADPH-cytochrome P450 reductase
MASVIQKFDLELVDPSYTLEIKQTLTIKPLGLRIRATPRESAWSLSASPSSTLIQSRSESLGPRLEPPKLTASATASGPRLYVLYGSNTGTSEAFAQRIATDAPSYGTYLVHFFHHPIELQQDSAHLLAPWTRRRGTFRRMARL